ncbi:MAG: hypothetical protein QNI90_15330, partial [Dinoroseobacter sp.]|nr:hypothetical protein [Dinoroseobacter sp.]
MTGSMRIRLSPNSTKSRNTYRHLELLEMANRKPTEFTQEVLRLKTEYVAGELYSQKDILQPALDSLERVLGAQTKRPSWAVYSLFQTRKIYPGLRSPIKNCQLCRRRLAIASNYKEWFAAYRLDKTGSSRFFQERLLIILFFCFSAPHTLSAQEDIPFLDFDLIVDVDVISTTPTETALRIRQVIGRPTVTNSARISSFDGSALLVSNTGDDADGGPIAVINSDVGVIEGLASPDCLNSPGCRSLGLASQNNVSTILRNEGGISGETAILIEREFPRNYENLGLLDDQEFVTIQNSGSIVSDMS